MGQGKSLQPKFPSRLSSAFAADEPIAFSIHESLFAAQAITWPDLFQNQTFAFAHVHHKPAVLQ